MTKTNLVSTKISLKDSSKSVLQILGNCLGRNYLYLRGMCKQLIIILFAQLSEEYQHCWHLVVSFGAYDAGKIYTIF